MNNITFLADVSAPLVNVSTNPLSFNDFSLLAEAFSNLVTFSGFILIIIGTWKILEKAGEQGWKAIIPFYNKYTFFKTFWHKKWFWFDLGATILSAISAVVFTVALIFNIIAGLSGSATELTLALASFMSADLESISRTLYSFPSVLLSLEITDVAILASMLILFACSIFSLVLKILLRIKIAKAFGKGAGFMVGLILLSPVFFMILGFSKDEYKKIA